MKTDLWYKVLSPPEMGTAIRKKKPAGKPAFHCSRFYPHPLSKRWEAITEKEAVSQWLKPSDIEPEIDLEFEFNTTGIYRQIGGAL